MQIVGGGGGGGGRRRHMPQSKSYYLCCAQVCLRCPLIGLYVPGICLSESMMNECPLKSSACLTITYSVQNKQMKYFNYGKELPLSVCL